MATIAVAEIDDLVLPEWSPPRPVHRTRAVHRILAMLFSLALTLACLELVLRTGLLDQTKSNTPSWIPPRLQSADRAVDLENWRYAQGNRFRFTDTDWPVTKPIGVTRIAVLGDSVIWGDGLPHEKVWSHKLAAAVRAVGHADVQVMSWGRNGWSTKDQLAFLKRDGYKYSPDLVIVGWVSNDPDLGRDKLVSLTWQDSAALAPARWVLPCTFTFVSAATNKTIERLNSRYGYANWYERLYTPDNLREYQTVLAEFRRFTDEHRIRLLFVHTPTNGSERYARFSTTIAPMLDSVGIEYLDLFPMARERFGTKPRRDLWANPADAHPGDAQTDLYSSTVFSWLTSEFFAH